MLTVCVLEISLCATYSIYVYVPCVCMCVCVCVCAVGQNQWANTDDYTTYDIIIIVVIDNIMMSISLVYNMCFVCTY